MVTTGRPVGVGIVGMGFMGATHARAYLAAARDGLPCRLLAVCDPSPELRAGKQPPRGNIGTDPGRPLFEPGSVAGHEALAGLLADDRISLVSVCTHTDSHVDVAMECLAAGKHVLVEKPVDLSPDRIRQLDDAAGRADRLCMPGMCMRFWPGWDWLKARIEDRSLGRLRGVTFERLGSRPSWGDGFYANPARSGGALFDLHIHDADFVYWCFGMPRAVASTGSIDHLTTIYRYDDGPRHVVAHGGWDHAPGFGFRMRFTAVFESATVEFDLGREPTVTATSDGRTRPVDVPRGAGYDPEVRHMIDLLTGDDPPRQRCTLADAAAVAELLQAERRSLDADGPVEL